MIIKINTLSQDRDIYIYSLRSVLLCDLKLLPRSLRQLQYFMFSRIFNIFLYTILLMATHFTKNRYPNWSYMCSPEMILS